MTVVDTTTENYLEHWGVKGMKWGRRTASSSSSDSSEKKPMSTQKKVAIAAGVTAGVAALAVGAVVAHRVLSKKEVSLKDIGDVSKAAKTAEKIAKGTAATTKISDAQKLFNSLPKDAQSGMRAALNTKDPAYVKKFLDSYYSWKIPQTLIETASS